MCMYYSTVVITGWGLAMLATRAVRLDVSAAHHIQSDVLHEVLSGASRRMGPVDEARTYSTAAGKRSLSAVVYRIRVR